ncbi:DUF2628 domain-containing protein [Fredinandcohnia sp. QZ13]|nr:DUF2628 domain-containing protein [Fredinandcohnia sp. QZ13]MDR4886256.1 DUF2628 domain-containing protein [Fredinandcohnia sp. QZ13]
MATFFLGPFWFGYRKMYIPVILIGILYFLLDLILYLTKYQFTEEFFFDPLQNIMLFPFSILFALFGNYFYHLHTKKYIDKVNLLPFNVEQKKTWLKNKGGTSWLGVMFTALFLILYGFISAYLLPTNVDQVLKIKDGSFYDCPTVTIGDGFDVFFDEPHWEYISSASVFDIVRFSGIAERGGEPLEVTIDFIIKAVFV